MIDISKEDYRRFYVTDPDSGFSPERNKAIVEGTIKKVLQNHIDRRKDFNEQLYERSDAVMSYIKRLVQDHKEYDVETYLGKKYLSELRGQRKLAKIRGLAQQKGFI